MSIKKENENNSSDLQNLKSSSDAVYQQTLDDALNNQVAAQNTSSAPISREEQIKQLAIKDIQTIENLMNSGVVSSEQGQNLKNYVVNKAYNEVKQQNQGQAALNQVDRSLPVNSYLNNLEQPEFFQQDGRSQVLDYLKNYYPNVGKDEVSQIIAMINNVEDSAVKRFLRKQEHDKALKDANEAAKQRLITNAQKSSGAGNGTGVIFTRDQIGKMSGAEFAKNEKLIMEQLKRGLIR